MTNTKTQPESVGSKAMVCNHFMVWNIQGGYSYYRCDKCTFIDGEETFKQHLLTSYAAGVAEGRSSMKRDIEAVMPGERDIGDKTECLYCSGDRLYTECICSGYNDLRSELLGKIGGIEV